MGTFKNYLIKRLKIRKEETGGFWGKIIEVFINWVEEEWERFIDEELIDMEEAFK